MTAEVPEDYNYGSGMPPLPPLGQTSAFGVGYSESTMPTLEAAVSRAYDETVLGWARVLELRHAETEGHSQRVGALAVQLAVELGIDASRLGWIWRGAILHDVGKMAIPDAILTKPGSLSPEERMVMETHPLMAREMLEPIHFLSPCLPIPLYHHERWDGKGYPVGLAGEDIPLEARLFSVVDVYDALTSDRPYRFAWTEARTIDYIVAGSGSMFDPAVVEAFVRIRRIAHVA